MKTAVLDAESRGIAASVPPYRRCGASIETLTAIVAAVLGQVLRGCSHKFPDELRRAAEDAHDGSKFYVDDMERLVRIEMRKKGFGRYKIGRKASNGLRHDLVAAMLDRGVEATDREWWEVIQEVRLGGCSADPRDVWRS